MTERSGLRRKIWVAFIMQAAAISFAAVLGVYGASAVLKHVLIQRALQEEAAHFWGRRQDDPQASVPDTYNMNGYLVAAGETAALPEPLQSLTPGFHSLPRAQGGSLVLVEDREGQRLYLLFKQEQVDSLAFWFGMAPLALVLAFVYILAWTTYRASKRAVSPVIWLANQVRQWDPKHPDASALDPKKLPVDVEGETLTLASSLHDFASRIGRFVEREHNFTRDASHELRTPLTVIRVAGDMMADDPSLSPSATRSLKRIQAAGRDMEALIEAFLILAREGDTGLPDEDFPVEDVVREEMEKVRPLHQRQGRGVAARAGGEAGTARAVPGFLRAVRQPVAQCLQLHRPGTRHGHHPARLGGDQRYRHRHVRRGVVPGLRAVLPCRRPAEGRPGHRPVHRSPAVRALWLAGPAGKRARPGNNRYHQLPFSG